MQAMSKVLSNIITTNTGNGKFKHVHCKTKLLHFIEGLAMTMIGRTAMKATIPLLGFSNFIIVHRKILCQELICKSDPSFL